MEEPEYEQIELFQKSVIANNDESALALKTKIIIGTLWFMASLFKSVGYYTPFIVLVKYEKHETINVNVMR